MEARQLSNGIETRTLSILSPEVGYIAFAVFAAKSRGQELYESRGGRLGLPVPNKPYGFCGNVSICHENRAIFNRLSVSSTKQRELIIARKTSHGLINKDENRLQKHPPAWRVNRQVRGS